MPLLGSSFKMSFGKVALNGGMPFQIYVSKFPGNLCSLSGRFCSEIHAENFCSQSSDLRDFFQKPAGNAVIYDIITNLFKSFNLFLKQIYLKSSRLFLIY